MNFKAITANGVMMAVCLCVGAMLGPRLFPAPTRAQADDGITDVVKCHRLEVVDKNGYSRIVMDAINIENSSACVFYREKGKPAIAISAQDNSSGIALYDRDYGEQLNLGVIDSRPSLVLFDIDGQDRCDMSLNVEQTPMLRFYDETKSIRSILSMGDKGVPYIRMFNRKGKIHWDTGNIPGND